MNLENLKEHRFEVDKSFHGERLDKFVAEQCESQTRSQIQYLILTSNVHLNGKVETHCAKKIRSGDQIDLTINTKPTTLEPYEYKLDIVYEDDDFMVINKPSGLTVHPGANTKNTTLANALVAYSKKLSTAGGDERPGIVHRLDKNTSGLMLVAKNNATHLRLSTDIMERTVKRKYLALVNGTPNPLIGQIATNVAPNKKDRTRMQVVNNNTGKIAITNYKVLKSYENNMFSLVECELDTGRTHQIRVHMKYKNNPIIGDQTYGLYYNFNKDAISEELYIKIKELKRQALHSYKLSLLHPTTSEPMNFEIPFDRTLQNLIDALSKSNYQTSYI
ncbi:MAG: 23S rRNA pseudouridine1911/1915/1917 synthase [Candidatus Midichloriaceae bacterium]|jgi:23S rRNA pseudouridine1911/1915/1917 synthase